MTPTYIPALAKYNSDGVPSYDRSAYDALDNALNLLVRSNKVIGGDVCSLQEKGFLHNFVLPEDNYAENSNPETPQ